MYSTSGLLSDNNLSIKTGAAQFITKPSRQKEVEEVAKQFAYLYERYAQ
jgi:hypothetical protein